MNQYYSEQAQIFNSRIKSIHESITHNEFQLKSSTDKSEKRKIRRILEKNQEILKNFKNETSEARTALYLSSEIREDIINDLITFIDSYREYKADFLTSFETDPERSFNWKAEGLIKAQETCRLADILINHVLINVFDLQQNIKDILHFLDETQQEVLNKARWNSNSTNPMANFITLTNMSAQAEFISKVKNLFSFSYAQNLISREQVVDQLPKGYTAG